MTPKVCNVNQWVEEIVSSEEYDDSNPEDFDDSDRDPDFVCNENSLSSSDSISSSGEIYSPKKEMISPKKSRNPLRHTKTDKKNQDNKVRQVKLITDKIAIETDHLKCDLYESEEMKKNANVLDGYISEEIPVLHNKEVILDSDVSDDFPIEHKFGQDLRFEESVDADTRIYGLQKKEKKKDGCKQVYDKHHFCTFCGVEIHSKISRHLLQVHKDEPRIMQINLLPPKSKKRLIDLEILENEGNFKHNVDVISKGEGNIVVARREEDNMYEVKDYLPCEYCKKFVLIKNMWTHHKTCAVFHFYYKTPKGPEDIENEDEDDIENNGVRRGRNLLNSALHGNTDSSIVKLLSRMKNDDIKECVVKDQLIRRFAALRVESLGSDNDQKINDMHRVSQSSRTLARLVMEATKSEKEQFFTLDSLISPQNFDKVVSVAKFMSIGKEVPAVSLGKYIGNLLGHIIQIKTGDALRNNDNSRYQDAVNFQKLFNAEWTYRVNSLCTKRLNTLKRNKVKTIPLTEDLKLLREYIMLHMKESSELLKKNKLPSDWLQLAKLTMCRLILFNKRRRAEVKDLKVKDYESRPDWKEQQKGEFEMALTPADKLLSER